MTIEELKQLGKMQVRNDANLLKAYIQVFKEKFGKEPNCTGCTFDSDWNELINPTHAKTQTMSNTTFKLFDNNEIYTYRKTNKAGVTLPVRTYGYLMTEEFAEAYLTEGTEEEIKKRKTEFKILPKAFTTDSKEEDTNDLSSLKVAELKALAEEKGLPEEDWKGLKKDELILYLEANTTDSKEEDTNA